MNEYRLEASTRQNAGGSLKMVATGIVLFDALCSIQFKTIHFCHRSTN